jgi:hypothetical protein
MISRVFLPNSFHIMEFTALKVRTKRLFYGNFGTNLVQGTSLIHRAAPPNYSIAEERRADLLYVMNNLKCLQPPGSHYCCASCKWFAALWQTKPFRDIRSLCLRTPIQRQRWRCLHWKTLPVPCKKRRLPKRGISS